MLLPAEGILLSCNSVIIIHIIPMYLSEQQIASGVINKCTYFFTCIFLISQKT